MAALRTSSTARVRVRRSARTTIAVGALVLGAAGCAGGTTRAEWRTAADAVCKRADAAIAKLAPPGNSLVAMVTYTDSVRRELRSEQRRLAALAEPDGDRAPGELRRYVAAEIDLVTQIKAAAEGGHADTVKALFDQAGKELAASGGRLAGDYRFSDCGSRAPS